MFSHIIALTAGILLASIPTSLFDSRPTSTARTQTRPSQRPLSPRPAMNMSLLAVDGPEDEPITCFPDAYGARILSTEPLVVYLEGFLSVEERTHLVEISEPLFEPSTFTNNAHLTTRNTTVRDSLVALLPRTPTVRCIERRALSLQSWRRDVFVERLRTQQYVQGGHYTHHFDWSRNVGGWGRVSSMMVWVDDGELTAGKLTKETTTPLRGGGTDFPRLDIRGREDSEGICEMVDCGGEEQGKSQRGEAKGGEEEGKGTRGTTFKVRPGNAIYWENFRGLDGSGYEETWHAGLPVEEGVKVGLNIWSFGRIE